MCTLVSIPGTKRTGKLHGRRKVMDSSGSPAHWCNQVSGGKFTLFPRRPAAKSCKYRMDLITRLFSWLSSKIKAHRSQPCASAGSFAGRTAVGARPNCCKKRSRNPCGMVTWRDWLMLVSHKYLLTIMMVSSPLGSMPSNLPVAVRGCKISKSSRGTSFPEVHSYRGVDF